MGRARCAVPCVLGLTFRPPLCAVRRTGSGQALGRCARVDFNGYPLSISRRLTRYSSGGLIRVIPVRGLILRRASRLDAVSAYPDPT